MSGNLVRESRRRQSRTNVRSEASNRTQGSERGQPGNWLSYLTDKKKMNITTCGILSGICFVLGFLSSIWPRKYMDQYKSFLKSKGKDPNLDLGFSQMKQIDAALFKKFLIGSSISMLFMIAFVVFMSLLFLSILNRN